MATEYKYKKDIFLESQIPLYIRDNYPLFVSFVKNYYEFLSRSSNEILAVKVLNKGKNYVNPFLSIKVIDTIVNSSTYGQYITDSRPVNLIPVVKNGRIEKVLVKNSKNVKYSKEERPVVVVSDSKGEGAEFELVIFHDMGNVYDVVQDLSYIRDVDIQNEVFKKYVLEELIPAFPSNLYSDGKYSVQVEKFVKFIRQIYNSKGIEAVFSFIYKILYNTTVSIYYPKTDILRVSDGIWIKNYYIVTEDNLTEKIGEKIVNQNGVTGIIMSCEPHPTLPGKWKVLIHERTGNFSSGDDIYLFNFKFVNTGEIIATVHSVEEDPYGYFKNDNGQLSSSKRIQDNYYYQEFSYEIQSEFNIKEFSQILNELLNPAGFKYFIKIIVDLESQLDLDAKLYYLNIIYPDVEIVSGEDAMLYKRSLGMTLTDVYKNPFFDATIDVTPIYDIFDVTPNTNISELEIYSTSLNNDLLLEANTMYGYSVYLYKNSWSARRTIVQTKVSENKIVLDSPFNTTETSVNVEVWPGYYFKNIVNSTTFELSDYDPFSIKTNNNNQSDPEKRFLIGYSLYILSGNVAGQRKKIVAYDGVNRRIVVESAFTQLPVNCIYRIINDLDGTEYFGGELSAVNVIKGGNGFTTATFVTDSPPGGSAPVFNVTISGGSVTAINITTPATAKYYTIPRATLTGDGDGVVYEIVVDFPQNSHLSQFLSKNRFQGIYFELQKDSLGKSLYFENARLRVYVQNNIIFSAIIENAGKGYVFIPRIYQRVGDGTLGKISATISSGQVSSLTVTGFGMDYNYEPEFVAEPPDPSISMIFSDSGSTAFMKMCHSSERDSYCTVLLDGSPRPEFSSANVNYYGSALNINMNSVKTYFTGFSPIKHNYNAEIEVIR